MRGPADKPRHARYTSGKSTVMGVGEGFRIALAITLPSKQRLRGKTNLVAAACEGDIFDALGLEWREPWERKCVVSPLDPTYVGSVAPSTVRVLSPTHVVSLRLVCVAHAPTNVAES